MNISSVIVHVQTENQQKVIQTINKLEGCEVNLAENSKLIVTIEANSIGEETGILKAIECMQGVLSTKMAFSYSEEELDAERDKIEKASDNPDWLNTNIDARSIKYTGNLKI